MGLNEEERETLVALEFAKAERALSDAIQISQLELWEATANRLYYAAFHAVNALLIHSSHPVSTHRGAVANFGRFFILPGLISSELGKHYSRLQSMRENGDYNCNMNVKSGRIVNSHCSGDRSLSPCPFIPLACWVFI